MDAEHGRRLVVVLCVAAATVVLMIVIAFEQGRTPHLLMPIALILVPCGFILWSIRKGAK